MKKLLLVFAVFVLMLQQTAHAQKTGTPVMGKIAQYTMIGGVGGAALFTAIWLSDPLGNTNLGQLALQGMSVGIVIGFSLGIYVVYMQSSTIPISKMDEKIRQEELKRIEQQQEQKDPEFLDFGDVFDSDKNYFEQIDQYNYIPQWDYIPPKYDPTSQDPDKKKDQLTYYTPIFNVNF